MNIIRKRMEGKSCSGCGETIYPDEWHNCFPNEIVNLTAENNDLRKQLDIAINTLKRIRGTTYPNGVPDSMLANDALEEIEKIGNIET
jgi:hypothetical protein